MRYYDKKIFRYFLRPYGGKMSDYDNIFLSKHHNIVCQSFMCDKCLMAAVYLEYMAAVFWKWYPSGSFFDKCKNGSAAVSSTRRGGRTDFYPKLTPPLSFTYYLNGRRTVTRVLSCWEKGVKKTQKWWRNWNRRKNDFHNIELGKRSLNNICPCTGVWTDSLLFRFGFWPILDLSL